MLGAIVPAIIGMLPTWIHPSSRSPRMHQNVLAMWQADPLYVSMIQQLFAVMMHKYATINARTSYVWTQGSLLLAAASSTIGHLYAKFYILKSAHRTDRFVRMYVPWSWNGSMTTPDILVHGPWLFLQFDLIIINLSSLSWAYLLCKLHCSVVSTQLVLFFSILLGTLVVGPGATVSLALCWREAQLNELRASKTTSGKYHNQ